MAGHIIHTCSLGTDEECSVPMIQKVFFTASALPQTLIRFMF